MKDLLIETDQFITLPAGIDFRHPGQPSPVRKCKQYFGIDFPSQEEMLIKMAAEQQAAASQGLQNNLGSILGGIIFQPR